MTSSFRRFHAHPALFQGADSEKISHLEKLHEAVLSSPPCEGDEILVSHPPAGTHSGHEVYRISSKAFVVKGFVSMVLQRDATTVGERFTGHAHTLYLILSRRHFRRNP